MTYGMYINEFSKVFGRWNDYRISEEPTIKKLRSCNARVYEYSDIIVLQSYSTIVAWYDKINEKILVYGYYSATTQQHISKFISDYCSPETVRLNGYCDSNNRVVYAYCLWGCWKRKGNTDTLYYKELDGNKSLITMGLQFLLKNVVSYVDRHF